MLIEFKNIYYNCAKHTQIRYVTYITFLLFSFYKLTWQEYTVFFFILSFVGDNIPYITIYLSLIILIIVSIK